MKKKKGKERKKELAPHQTLYYYTLDAAGKRYHCNQKNCPKKEEGYPKKKDGSTSAMHYHLKKIHPELFESKTSEDEKRKESHLTDMQFKMHKLQKENDKQKQIIKDYQTKFQKIANLIPQGLGSLELDN